MCGIAGVIGPGKYHEHLDEMLDRISHRGPDGRGTWTAPNVSLGHLRLSIIDLSDNASQPMIDPDTGDVLIFNGEIYNYIELRNELKSRYTFRTSSDTEVILAAYRRWGTRGLERLRGMFALALFDAKDNHVLLARDRLGIKPLYYRRAGDTFMFASEIKALVNIAGLKDDVNNLAMLEFLADRHQDVDERTFFTQVHQLLPGQLVTIDTKGKRSRFLSFWDDKAQFANRKIDQSTREEFLRLMIETVSIHLRSDVELGSFVSGGLDSSSVACIAAEELGANTLHTFSSVLESKNEENALIPHVQRKLRGIDHELKMTGDDFLEILPRLVYHQDEPFADASMYAHYLLCRLAREHGIKVLLSGNGGDEIFGGYASHVYAYLGHLLKRARMLKLQSELASLHRNRGESLKQLASRALQEASPFKLRANMKRNAAASLTAHTHLGDALNDYRFYYEKDGDPWRANFTNNLRHWTVPPFLHYEDRNSMAFGVEVRVPFLDHVLVEFMQGIAPESVVTQRSKSLLRDAMRGIVPDPVLDQKGKYGFAAPLDLFVGSHSAALLDMLDDTLRDVPFLDFQKSLNICRSYFSTPTSSNLLGWRTFCAALWYKLFFTSRFTGLASTASVAVN